jgi:hypothetical protein
MNASRGAEVPSRFQKVLNGAPLSAVENGPASDGDKAQGTRLKAQGSRHNKAQLTNET